MVVDYLQYIKSTCSSSLLMGGALIERVSHGQYKLLGSEFLMTFHGTHTVSIYTKKLPGSSTG